MAKLFPGLLYSLIWLIILFFIWPVFAIIASVYILLLPLQACLSFLEDIATTLLRWMQFAKEIGINIKEMKPLC